MPDTAAFCPGCGRDMHVSERAEGRVGALPEVVAGALAYCTFIPAVVFLVVDPYKRNRFVRFHSFQCVFAWVAGLLIGIAVKLVSYILLLVPIVGHLLILLISIIVTLAIFVLWLVLLAKALQGEMFKLPLIGEFAQQQAEAV